MPRIAVLGAGVSGLAAAQRLQELASQQQLSLEVLVFEASSRAGGCIDTRQERGFTLELGADSFLTEKPAGVALLERLGLRDQIVGMRPGFRGACVVRAGRLVAIPPDFRLFAPTSFASLAGSGLFSARGVVRAALEPFVPRRPETGDESLASFVARRFGREVLDRLAQPLAGGIYSGDPRQLSMQATLPQFVEMERRYASVMRGARVAMRDASQRRSSLPRLAGLAGGLDTLTQALAARLGDTLHYRSDVRHVECAADGTWELRVNGQALKADAVICTLPAPHAAQVLEGAHSALARRLGAIATQSVATLNLAFDGAGLGLRLPKTYGFVVPAIEGRTITAATIAHQKYADRAPVGHVLVRAFVGGALQAGMLARDDGELQELVLRDLRELLGITTAPLFCVVTRWQGALPEYRVGHTDVVRDILRDADTLPRFALAGAAYGGVGIPDCIRSGESAAEGIVAQMNRPSDVA